MYSRKVGQATDGLRVLINGCRALPATAGSGGAGKFLDALLRGIAGRTPVRVLTTEKNRGAFPAVAGVEYVVITDESEHACRGHLDWCDIYYDPLNGLRPLDLPARLPVATAIMDLQHNVLPRNFPTDMYQARNRDYGFAIRRASGVITISEFEKQNIRRVYGDVPVWCVHLAGFIAEYARQQTQDASGSGFIQRADAAAAAPYFIFPAVPWRHKNHYLLLEAVGLVQSRPELSIPGLRLICTGVEQHAASTTVHLWKHAAEKLDGVVEFRGHLDDEEFARLMRAAAGLIFPSLYEGFGIPVVEAMQLGVPVLAVRETAVPEVAGEAAWYFSDPRNSLAMARDIREFAADHGRRAELSRKGVEQSQRFSTERMSTETLTALEAIRDLHSSRPAPEIGLRRPLLREEETAPRAGAFCLVEELRPGKIAETVRALRADLGARLFADSPVLWILDRSVPLTELEQISSELQPGERFTLADITDDDEVILALRYGCESFAVSDYVVYTRSGRPFPASRATVSAALAFLDRDESLGAALLDPANAGWITVPRLENQEEAFAAVQKLRARPLPFFDNLIVRATLVRDVGYLGSVRLLSHLLRHEGCLTGPAQD